MVCRFTHHKNAPCFRTSFQGSAGVLLVRKRVCGACVLRLIFCGENGHRHALRQDPQFQDRLDIQSRWRAVLFLVKGPHGNAPARPRLGGIRKTVRHANARAHRHRTWPHALHAPRHRPMSRRKRKPPRHRPAFGTHAPAMPPVPVWEDRFSSQS